ncbi:MAG: tRNA (adenosine(37)-N6)-dimethylallyltransferase MiaA [Candidatus Aureabacteria bacterium]|nr:tRNA (adenosine(37)-N6)-dimethylallyltransferase MiaA [Candidatus Auribacterota bacterium]
MRNIYRNLPIIAIAGPTATGKTKASICLASKIDAEIVSCDSMQVYEDIPIGTAKPGKAELKKIRHHMIGTIKQNKVFCVADFLSLASKSVKKIKALNKNVLLVGGTGLYLKTLFEGMFEGPSRNNILRAKLDSRIEKEGLQKLYEELKKKDPVYAENISEHDKRRIIRAIEVMEKTGEKFSDIRENKEPFIKGEHLIFCLNFDRGKLYERIENRVDKMIEKGLIEEAKELFDKKLSSHATLRQAIGYKELFSYFNNKVSKEEAIDLIKRNTRRFAKRQLTWFRGMKDVIWIDADRHFAEIAEDILSQSIKRNRK